MTPTDVHIVVISWVGMAERSRRIAAALDGHAGRLTVIYSNPDEAEERGAGDWVRVPNSHFFGRKFEAALARHPEAMHLLLIHADTDCDDWPGLVDRCARAFAQVPELGVWSPDFDHTGWATPDVAIGPVAGTTLLHVVQTDAIIVALAPAVAARMRRLDYRANNLGWGIGWAAVSHAYARGLIVARDTGLVLRHMVTRGYDSPEAAGQMQVFLTQLTEAERVQMTLLLAWHGQRRRARSGWTRRALNRMRLILPSARPLPRPAAGAAKV